MKVSGIPNFTTTEHNGPTKVHATGPAPGTSRLPQKSKSVKPLGNAGFRPAAVFTDNMVLQRGVPTAVFGTGQPGKTISARLSTTSSADLLTLCDGNSTDSVSVSCTIASDGTWNVSLPAMEAGMGYVMTVSDEVGTTLAYHNAAIGEVWLAGGQSNMEFELHQALHGEEDVATSSDPYLRFFNTPKSGTVDDDLLAMENATAWQTCNPQTSGSMSAVAYYFARTLRRKMGARIPVGIIDCYIGGTSISCWMSEKILSGTSAGRAYLERYQAQIAGKSSERMHEETYLWQQDFDRWNAQITSAQKACPGISWETLDMKYGQCPWPPPMTPFAQRRPTGPYQAMIQRTAPYSLAGILWYQGEEDEPYCDEYETLLTCMIDEWRDVWGSNAMPFIIAQLPQWVSKQDYDAKKPGSWPVIRQAQWNVSERMHNVFITVLMDCGEFNNIHPIDKQTPGERMARTALAKVYGISSASADGPMYSGAEAQADGTVLLRLEHAQGPYFRGTTPGTYRNALVSSSRGSETSGFELAGPDGVFLPACATITSSSSPDAREGSQTILLGVQNVTSTSPQSEPFHPRYVRYGWFDWGPAPLFNADRLPCAPFSAEIESEEKS